MSLGIWYDKGYSEEAVDPMDKKNEWLQVEGNWRCFLVRFFRWQSKMYRIHTGQITVKTVYLKRLTVSIEAKFQFFSIELEQKTYE